MTLHLILLIIISLAAFFAVTKLRRSSVGRYSMKEAFNKRFALSIGLSAAVQLYTVLPGWIVGAYLIGKGDFAATILGDAIWRIAMIVSNTLFYLPIFYLLIKILNHLYGKIFKAKFS